MRATLRHVVWREGDPPVDLGVTERVLSAEFNYDVPMWHIVIISEWQSE